MWTPALGRFFRKKKMKKSIFILLLLFSSIRCFAKDKIKFFYNGSWSSVYICDWYIKNGNFKFDNWKNKFKYLKTDFLIIDYSETEKKGIFYINGISPWEIRKVYQEKNKVYFECFRLSPYINGPEESVNLMEFEKYRAVDEKEVLHLTIVDDNEIIFDSTETHFYRIASPCGITDNEVMINDSNIRLRNKPNLKSKTWTLLKEGTVLKIKNRSPSKETIDGEEFYWYNVEVDGYPDGWVYGKYITIKG